MAKLLRFGTCSVMSDKVIGFSKEGRDMKIFLEGGGVATAYNAGQYEYSQLFHALEENQNKKEMRL